MSQAATGTQALDRAAQLVATVVRADEPLAFAELQESAELPKSTASRLLAALERTELLERDDSGSYVAGPLFWLYATRHDPWDELVRLARSTMAAISEVTRETVHLAVARGDRVVHVDQVDSQYLLGARDWTEIDVPAHTSALGKVLLAFGALDLPEGPLATPTGASIDSRERLVAELERVREDRWAAVWDELEEGLAGLAVPVHAARGDVVAALGVSGPTQRLEGRHLELGRELTTHADRLSQKLSKHAPRRANQEEGVA